MDHEEVELLYPGRMKRSSERIGVGVTTLLAALTLAAKPALGQRAEQEGPDSAIPKAIELTLRPQLSESPRIDVDGWIRFDSDVGGREAAITFRELTGAIVALEEGQEPQTYHPASSDPVMRIGFPRRPGPSNLNMHFRWSRALSELVSRRDLVRPSVASTTWSVDVVLPSSVPLARFRGLGYECDEETRTCHVPASAEAISMPTRAQITRAEVTVDGVDDDVARMRLEIVGAGDYASERERFVLPEGASQIDLRTADGQAIPFDATYGRVSFGLPPTGPDGNIHVVATYQQHVQSGFGWLHYDQLVPGPTSVGRNGLTVDFDDVHRARRPISQLVIATAGVGVVIFLFTIGFLARWRSRRRDRSLTDDGRRALSESLVIYVGALITTAFLAVASGWIGPYPPAITAPLLTGGFLAMLLLSYVADTHRGFIVGVHVLAIVSTVVMLFLAFRMPEVSPELQVTIGAGVFSVLSTLLGYSGVRYRYRYRHRHHHGHHYHHGHHHYGSDDYNDDCGDDYY